MDCDDLRKISVARSVLLSVASTRIFRSASASRYRTDAACERFCSRQRRQGGKFAVLARRLGVPARLLRRVGDDAFREQALGPLREAGIDLAHVSTAPGCATALSMIAVLPNGHKSIILANNVSDEEDVRRAVGVIGGAPEGSVLVADYEVPPRVVERAVRAAAPARAL